MSVKTVEQARTRRHKRIRGRLAGTAERPRVSVYRSNRSIYAQAIDDVTGTTLVAVRSSEVDPTGDKTAVAGRVGLLLAERAKAKGIVAVVFDRSGYLYHGRVKALAEGAREGGLQF
jgi:large subunit ribosomal protein L18